MTKDEALEMALEFIERVTKDGWILADFEPQMYATITAIKEALAQRTWVGLTHAEVNSWELPDCPTVFEFAQFIEAKLKQKNGYVEEKNT